MNHYININNEISNTKNYFHENAKINNINYRSSNNHTKHIKYCRNKNNNSTLINPYKINSINSQKNLSQMLNGIKDGIEEISIQMKNTDDKIENYIKKNYIKNRPINTKLYYHNRICLQRPRSQGKKLLSVNNSFISNTNQIRDNNNNKSTNISNITYQCEYTNTSGNKIINRQNINNSNDSAQNILCLTNQNMNNKINDYNNIFSKSSNNFNNKNPLHLSHSKNKNEKEVINKNLNLSYIDNNNNSNTHPHINNNCKYLYRAPSNKAKHKEIIQLNEVLQKQIIEVRLQLYDANKKIEDYSEVIKNLKIENKNLFDEKKYYENKYKELSEESNYDKNYKINEIESQKKIIGQMDMEISQLNNIINEKDTLIQNLKAQVNLMFNLNNLDNNNNNNEIFNMDKKITKKMSNSNINSHINGINNLSNNAKYNKILFTKLDHINVKTEINNLKEEFEKLINSNNKNKTHLFNRKSESNKITKSIGKIKNENNATSLLELKKIKNEYSSLKKEYNLLKNEDDNLRKEYEKINNKIKSLLNENKKINELYNKLKIEYEKIDKKNIDIKYDEKDLGKLKEENNILQTKIIEQKKTIEQLIKTNNDINKNSETENQKNKSSMLKLENEITSLKKEKDNLSKINQEIKNSNEELKSKNDELLKEKNKNITQIKELKNLNEEQKKSNNILQKNLEAKNNELIKIEKQLNEKNKNIEGNEMLEQKIKKLEENKINLEKKIVEYENKIKELQQKNKVSDINKESFSNDKINQINLGEKKYLDENVDELKKEISSLKEKINELENENHNYMLEATKLKEAEEKIKSIKNENELNFNALKTQQKENQKLLKIINNYKNNKNSNLQNAEDIEGDEEEDEENEISQDSFNSGVNNKSKNKKKIILELKNQLKEKDKEINEFKKIKGYLTKDNIDKQETIEKLKDNSVSSKQEQSYILIIETLKKEIKENQHTISELTKKNTELNDQLKSNNIQNSNNNISKKKNKFEKANIAIGDEIDNNKYHSENRIDNNRLSRISGITSTSNGLTDQERIDKYKKQIKEYKKEIESHKNQINTLKEEIRELNHKLKNPIFQNLEEFINLFHIAFSDYKPNKKEQKEAFEKIIQNFGLNNI